MESQRKVSVITVTYNASRTLQRCLDSVSMQVVQEPTHIEHLVIDGASTDGTIDIVKNWVCESVVHSRRYISEPDQGLYDAMNKGAALAKGEIIVFLNADDQFADETAVARSIAPILSGESDYVCAPAIINRQDGSFSHIQRPDLSLPYLNHPFNTQTMFVKRQDFLRLGGHDLSYKVAGDDEFDCKLISAGMKCVALTEPTVIAQDGGFGVTHYYAHERARLLRLYQKEILTMCAINKYYAFEYYVALMRISKVHPRSSCAQHRIEAGRILIELHAEARRYCPFFARIASLIVQFFVLKPIIKGCSIEKNSIVNILISLFFRFTLIR